MIENTIQQIIKELPPSSGPNLSGFLQDTEWSLFESNSFTSVDVVSTDDPNCLIQAKVEISSDVSSLQNLMNILFDVWQRIRYSHFDSTSCQWYKEATVFRFVTVISDNSFFVTGKIIASGPFYANLAQNYERDFGVLEAL